MHKVLGTKQREAFGPTFWRKVRIYALDSYKEEEKNKPLIKPLDYRNLWVYLGIGLFFSTNTRHGWYLCIVYSCFNVRQIKNLHSTISYLKFLNFYASNEGDNR